MLQENPSHGSAAVKTDDPVRHLDANTLGLSEADATYIQTDLAAVAELRNISDEDPYLQLVKELMIDGYAGVIFSGPPGTGKTWYADQISRRLINGDYPERQRLIQFHHSYQYEDFMQGYVPKEEEEGGFRLARKHFLEMCDIAREAAPDLCVLVIDELSRSDPGRVFGEALTYIETDKREREFRLASGTRVSVPRNLFIIATMNPVDRGADLVDIAFERRFAKIDMPPEEAALRTILSDNGMSTSLADNVVQFFRYLQRHPNEHAKVGHAYFVRVKDAEGLKRLWNHQLRFYMERAFRLDLEERTKVERQWNRIFDLPGVEEDEEDAPLQTGDT